MVWLLDMADKVIEEYIKDLKASKKKVGFIDIILIKLHETVNEAFNLLPNGLLIFDIKKRQISFANKEMA